MVSIWDKIAQCGALPNPWFTSYGLFSWASVRWSGDAFLIRSDSTLADLHCSIQIAIGWSDSHLHRFLIHGKEYGIFRAGGPWYTEDAGKVRLSVFALRLRERFSYQYDFGDNWEHEIRVEAILAPKLKQIYPVCTAGRRAGPPEDCGGPWAYMEMIDHRHLPLDELQLIAEVLDRVLKADPSEKVRAVLGDAEAFQEAVDQLEAYTQFRPDQFDRRAVNRQLKKFSVGDKKRVLDRDGEGEEHESQSSGYRPIG